MLETTNKVQEVIKTTEKMLNEKRVEVGGN